MSIKVLKNYQTIWKIVKNRYPRPIQDMLILGLFLMIHTLLSVAVPYILKEIVDQSHTKNVVTFDQLFTWKNLYILATAYALGWLLMNVLNHAANFLSARLMTKFKIALLHGGVKQFFEATFAEQKKIELGVYQTDILRGASSFGTITYVILFVLVPILFQILSMVWVLAHAIELAYALYFMLFAVITFALNIYFTAKGNDIFTAMYNAQNQVGQFLVEKIQTNYDIKVNGAQQYEMNLYEKRLEHYKDEILSSHKKLAGLMVIQVLFVGFFLLSFMLLTVYLFSQKQVTSGDFVLISTYIIALTMPLLMVSQSIIHLKGDFIAIEKFEQYFHLMTDQLSSEVIIDQPIFYAFKQAEFYLGKNLITDFDFVIEQGKNYIAIGQTGIGKTSFINYLIGLEKIKAGQLFYKNVEISQQFSENIFKEIAVVSQMPVVYSGTFRENLVHNSHYTYTDDELYDYLERFNLLNLINKNNLALDDNIKHVYKSFSGGEKQRISIIRALLKKPQLLIMDEPTAALDEQTSMALMKFIQSQVKTTFIISHANFAQQYADEVINFDTLIQKSAIQKTDLEL
ncbi:MULTISPECIES: ABC transporter ATP-binding protein [unclassified Acinetobacter]|uniref:ATP-binding cassette domain-containing protein n=1 Tax=unclassified Acinetobacter TaxID=196816 RepID=UPI0025757031|nr:MULTISPECIES: ABC transporter ATP-binding protein [unclassified Acinetobacter]MDM1763646.1 ABC transporter ATP-binding protein [Acinetobacter sp. 226-1]MDM1767125.1 ABC transporter ATP-binding protein [Acinetobacter sp. 226-4]